MRVNLVVLIALLLIICANDVQGRRGRGRGRSKSRVNFNLFNLCTSKLVEEEKATALSHIMRFNDE